ncbi:MAG: hypothetical protein ACYSU0_20600 [Planctomycetota bacterium]
MSDSPATNEEALPPRPADAASAPDELAKDLPGLPIELRDCYVAEQGFYPKPRGDFAEARVPWHEVTGFRPMGFGSTAIEAQSPDACEARLVPLSATKEQLRILRAAWREYILRRIERDGALKGTYYLLRPKLQYTAAFALSLLLVASALGSLAAAWALSQQGSGLPGLRLAAWFLGSLYLLVGVLALAASVRLKRIIYVAQLHWYRWEIRKTGLVHWPHAEETELVPSAGDALAPGEAGIGGSLVPLRYLTHRDAVAPLLLAMGEQAGADIRPDFGSRWPVLIFLGTGACMLVSVAAALVWTGGETALTMLAMAAALTVAVAVAFAAGVVSRPRRRGLLADGRAMLERLGW